MDEIEKVLLELETDEEILIRMSPMRSELLIRVTKVSKHIEYQMKIEEIHNSKLNVIPDRIDLMISDIRMMNNG
jgi:hypothetical protein